MLGPLEEFSKTFTYYCGSVIELQFDREKLLLFPIHLMPHAKKTAVFDQLGVVFDSRGGGASRLSGEGVILLQDPPVPL